MAGTNENIPSVVRKEDASCFRCNLSRVVTTFQSPDVSRAGFALSRGDFYFKARGDRLCSAVRRLHLLFKQSHPGNEPLKNRISEWRIWKGASLWRFVIRANLKFLKKKKREKRNNAQIEICTVPLQIRPLSESNGKTRFRESDSIYECDRVMEIRAGSRPSVKFIEVQAGFAERCKSGLSRYPAANVALNTTGIGASRMARKSN